MRVFYGLNRFSEDLDFSLKQPNSLFSFEKYLPQVAKEAQSFGFSFDYQLREKATDGPIRTAFMKANAREHVLMLYPQDKLAQQIHFQQTIKVKLEADTNPACGATL